VVQSAPGTPNLRVQWFLAESAGGWSSRGLHAAVSRFWAAGGADDAVRGGTRPATRHTGGTLSQDPPPWRMARSVSRGKLSHVLCRHKNAALIGAASSSSMGLVNSRTHSQVA
jgi:hypothetical protein